MNAFISESVMPVFGFFASDISAVVLIVRSLCALNSSSGRFGPKFVGICREILIQRYGISSDQRLEQTVCFAASAHFVVLLEFHEGGRLPLRHSQADQGVV